MRAQRGTGLSQGSQKRYSEGSDFEAEIKKKGRVILLITEGKGSEAEETRPKAQKSE